MLTQYLRRLRHLMPAGRSLPDAAWDSRHRSVVILLWLHVLAVACAETFLGHALANSMAEVGIITAATLLASCSTFNRVFRATIAGFGLITASAVLVHLSGGYIEMHFHFFVIVIIIALYQEWLPFLLPIGYVVLHHGLIGTLIPTHVYNHPAAWANPWQWAAIHGLFIIAASLASLVSWRNNEAARTQAELALRALEERTQRLEVVRAVTEEITRELDLTTLLELIARRTAELVGVPSSTIYLWDNAADAFTPRAWYGLGDWMRDVRFRMGEGIPGVVGQCREGLLVNDYRSSPYAAPLFVEHTGITAVLASPLLYRSHLLGIITLNNGRTGRHFSEQDGDLLGLFAAQAAIAIQNAHLYAETGRRQREAEVVAELAKDINASLDLDTVIRRVVEGAKDICGSDQARITLRDPTCGVMRFRYWTGVKYEGYATATIEPGKGLGGQVLLTKRPERTDNYAGDPRFSKDYMVWARANGTIASMVVPILIGDHVEGLLIVANHCPRPFTDADESILTRLADHVAIAIRNASLYEALRSSEERTRLILESALDSVITMDQTGNIADWNPQAEATFGWSRQEAIGRPLAETIIPAQYRDAHRRGLQRFLETGHGPVLHRRIEISALHRDGREFPVELAISPMHMGQSLIFSAFIRDITERKRAEAELQQAKESAEAAAQAKGEFLANMSHEIRTPMNGILGMTELALDTPLTADQREYLTTVKASGDALLGIINDILDFSKIEAGKLALDAAPFALRHSLGATLKTLALQAHAKELELAYVVQPEVPDLLVGDSGRLRQIVINLVGNAIKFTQHGEVVVAVETASPITDTVTLHVTVRDTGIGIPADKQQVILEPFMQADGSTTRQYGGTGLGLAISKQLAELMGGRLWLESAVGRGSTFHFTVCFDVQPASAAQPGPTHPVDVCQLPVLVVDDNATTRRILHDMLCHWHMQPTAVESGQAALATLAQARDAGTPYPLVLLDARMPEMDGFHVAARLRQDPTLVGATILLLSSTDPSGDAVRCRRLAISTHLSKPIIQSDLWEAIMTALCRTAEKKPQAFPVSPIPPTNSPGWSILLAEDNMVNQLLAIRMLEKRGHQVEVVGTGKAALATLAQHRFDLILMDVQMPEFDGFETTAAIRAQERDRGGHLPIIAMTAHAMEGDRERCLAAGMDDYVAKPVKAADLYAAIERLLPDKSIPD